MRDTIFKNNDLKNDDLVSFRFDERTAAVFEDMVRRSVPGYGFLIDIVGLLARCYGQDDTNYYDLGAATGASALALGLNNRANGIKIVAVDSSPAMVEKCRRNLAKLSAEFEVMCDDVADVCIRNASIVVFNLTLQFTPIATRGTLLCSIYEGMLPGGVLLLGEKITHESKEKQQRFEQLYRSFKQANGYSDVEISGKRKSLIGVLECETVEAHITRLSDVGFVDVYPVFQCLNFVGFLAWKPRDVFEDVGSTPTGV